MTYRKKRVTLPPKTTFSDLILEVEGAEHEWHIEFHPDHRTDRFGLPVDTRVLVLKRKTNDRARLEKELARRQEEVREAREAKLSANHALEIALHFKNRAQSALDNAIAEQEAGWSAVLEGRTQGPVNPFE